MIFCQCSFIVNNIIIIFMNSSNTTLADFTPIEKLGEGTYSSVYKVRRYQDNQLYALKKIKILQLKPKQKQNALNEIRILSSFYHQNIIGFKEAFLDKRLQLLCVVMELANEGDLKLKIKSKKSSKLMFQERQIWKVAHDICNGLKVLHDSNILHRDIKSANIFISNGTYKLGDLNVAKIQSNQFVMAQTQTGTPFYASPEVWRQQPYGYQADIWSLGCMIYELCFMKPPFNGHDLSQLNKNIQHAHFQDATKLGYSKQLRRFIKMCLQKIPERRPSCNELLQKGGIIQRNCQIFQIETSNNYQQNTIRDDILLPENLSQLNKILPPPRYFPLKKQDNTTTSLSSHQLAPPIQLIDRSQSQKKKINLQLKNKNRYSFIQQSQRSMLNSMNNSILLCQHLIPQKNNKKISVSEKPVSDQSNILNQISKIQKSEHLKTEKIIEEVYKQHTEDSCKKKAKHLPNNQSAASRAILNHINAIQKLNNKSGVERVPSTKPKRVLKAVFSQQQIPQIRKINHSLDYLKDISKRLQHKKNQLKKINSTRLLHKQSNRYINSVSLENPDSQRNIQRDTSNEHPLIIKKATSKLLQKSASQRHTNQYYMRLMTKQSKNALKVNISNINQTTQHRAQAKDIIRQNSEYSLKKISEYNLNKQTPKKINLYKLLQK